MGKHSADQRQSSAVKQLLSAMGGSRKAGRHSATASDVLDRTSRKPMFAAIAIPTVAIAAVTAAGVGSQQGGGQVSASTTAISDDLTPLSAGGSIPKPKSGAKYQLKQTTAEFEEAAGDMGKGKTSKAASGKSGSCEASTYGENDGTAGGPTASGETFDPSKMTAANKELPLGSIVKVTNKGNGKSVTVRINDRGPYIAGRCLDLSTAAMAKIAGAGEGTAQVTFQVQ